MINNNLLFVLRTIKENPDIHFVIKNCIDERYSIDFEYFYKKGYWNIIHCNYRLFTSELYSPTDVYNFFLNHKCEFVKYNNTYRVFASNYSPKDLSAKIILKYWKKYRWNYRKNKIDPLKKELIEYIYHPSRINFNL
jgi:hypothetical protein